MEQFSAVEIWSISASIVSVILGIMAIGISIYFFVINRNTESNVKSSLTKIETQADMLQKITGRQMDRLTKIVADQKPGGDQSAMVAMVKMLSELPQTITASLPRDPNTQNNEQLINELITCYIGLYFYSAQTNWWAQLMLPDADEFDPNNVIQTTAKRIVDLSASDFELMAKTLAKVDPAKLANSPVVHLLEETKGTWKDLVRTSSEVFIIRGKE